MGKDNSKHLKSGTQRIYLASRLGTARTLPQGLVILRSCGVLQFVETASAE